MKTKNIHVVGLGGSLRLDSRGEVALKLALTAASKAGATVDLIALRDLHLPLFDPEQPAEFYGDALTDLLDRVRRADAMLWSCPAYHGTLSGAFKNVLDYLEFLNEDTPPYLSGKVVGLIATGGGDQAALHAISAMTHAAFALRGMVAPVSVPIHRVYHSFDDENHLTDERILQRLNLLGEETTNLAALLRK